MAKLGALSEGRDGYCLRHMPQELYLREMKLTYLFDTIQTNCACSGSTYIKIGTIQRRLAWPLRKDDTQIREAFQIFAFVLMKYARHSLHTREKKQQRKAKTLATTLKRTRKKGK